MPAASTHAEFAKTVLESLPLEKRRKITNLSMYYLGSQGPDLLFFSRYMFLPGSLHRYGNMMHSGKVREVIHYFDRHCVTMSLRSYFYGYLTHYALDSTCHGIINACAKKENLEKGTHESEAHFRLEGELDAWTLNQSGRSVSDYNVFSMLKVQKTDAQELARLYHDMFQRVYGISVSKKTLEDACYDCARITFHLRPGKIRFFIASWVESVTHAPRLISGMMLYDKEGASPSVLNLSHHPWIWYGESKKSYPELFEEAKTLAMNLFESRDNRFIQKNFNSVPLGETIL